MGSATTRSREMTFKVASYIYIAAHQSTWYWLRCSAKCTFWSFKDFNKKRREKQHQEQQHHPTNNITTTTPFFHCLILHFTSLKAYIEVSDLPYLSETDRPAVPLDRLPQHLPPHLPGLCRGGPGDFLRAFILIYDLSVDWMVTKILFYKMQ